MILNVFSALIVSAVVCSGILIVFYSLYNGISPMPTSPKVKRQLLHVLSQNEIQGTIYELGSGWGTLAFELARRFPECRIIAYENSWVPYIYSKIYGLAVKTENLRIKQENFFNILLSRADVVVCYLSPNIMTHLQPKLESELQKGTLVVTNTFALPSWVPQQTIEVEDLYRTKIHIYLFNPEYKRTVTLK
ncbi:TPA: class I SAM-dependent methyltransferase [Candidatus Poribacteria bacterium]|nr:class I SAM-dependent methyltransferase [Candidatus Poribacteria bacterium]HIM10777.1 class I SAM-dependent methyltransferase [Candidatus Poribacteria bacterium]